MSPGITIFCDRCPLCGKPPGFIVSTQQAFCESDDCLVVTWDMTQTADWNLANANPIDLSGLP